MKINNLEEQPTTPLKKRDEILKWLATGFITLSALQVSFNLEWAMQWWAFLGFFTGHIIWSVFAIKMREWPLLALNFTFIFIDAYAMFIRI